MDYRSIPRISNSDLTEFKEFIFGEVPRKPVGAFAFGSALHELILEPNTILRLPENVDLDQVQRLARTARSDRFLAWALRFGRKESVRLWSDPATGLPLKSKLDIVYRDRLVVDIKSTSCRSLPDFLTSCERYDYDRQAAYYLDSVGATRFVFVAVQKVSPFGIWSVEASAAQLDSGRRKYKALLREWSRREVRGETFRPSSWLAPVPEGEAVYA